VSAQLVVGDNLHMTMNGTAGFGYSGSYGNFASSGHGLGFGFNGLMNGYYFNPNFVYFDFRPYFDRMQSNSDSQSIARGTGFSTSAGFFGNSYFPGSVSYGRDVSSNSEYNIGGVPSVLTDSSSQTFGISWSLLLPNKPTLTATYGIGSSNSTITGTDMQSSGSNRTLTLGSHYKWAGWDMYGSFGHYNSDFSSPTFLTGTAEERSSNGTNYSFTTSHKIPIDGSVSLGWSHQNSSSSENDHSSGTSYSASAGITPFGRLGLSGSASYSTNGAESLAYSVLGPAAGSIQLIDRNAKTLFLTSSASIYIFRGLSVNGHITRREEDFGFGMLSDTQYGGTLTYHSAHRWLGKYYVSGGVVDNANKLGNTGAGLTGTVGMDRHFGHWETSADFNYMQNVQTLYSIVNTSNMNYGGSIRRKLNQSTYLSLFGRSSRSGLVTVEGTDNMSNSGGASLSWKGYSFSGNYSVSNGTGVINSNGTLVPTATGPLFTPDFVYFDAKSVGISASKRFFRKLLVSFSYSQVQSSTEQKLGLNANSGERYTVNTTYNFRKVSFNGGYTRSSQAFSTLIGGPRVVNSYFFSINRWFNIF
jgi:hypothetical protein